MPEGEAGEKPRGLFRYPKFWAHRLGPAPFLPMSRAEMDALGWDCCDVILVTGDAYIDHPSFGMAIIGRLLEAQGFRVGIIAQPAWDSVAAFQALGRPALFFGVTGGNMDSMVNRYTADRRLRHNDAYTPNEEEGKRPDRAVIVYSQRCREAYRDVPILIGGIEASLRRIAHYDYWSDTVRRSILVDSKADLLVYGNAERAIVAIAHRTARGEAPRRMMDIRGTAFIADGMPEGWRELDCRDPEALPLPPPPAASGPGTPRSRMGKLAEKVVIRLPSFAEVRDDRLLYAHAARLAHLETNPGNARPLVQRHDNRDVWLNPPPLPLGTGEMDQVFELPYARAPHPAYGSARIPAWEMIRFSITLMRGCFGGCSFCSITEHEGRIIQSRSEDSVLREIATVRDQTPGFTGVISDLGGPTANMYRLGCRDPALEAVCRRPSCVYPELCTHLGTDHAPLVALYRKARTLPGIRKITIASGLRYDLALTSPAYIRELVTHHVGGYLKIAPEHTEPEPLARMMKPGIALYDRFQALFARFSREAGKEQYLIPYFIAAHPGTTDQDMLNLALWLKRHNYRLEQVQTFLPAPMAVATAMYHSGLNPQQPVRRSGGPVVSCAKGLRQRRLHKAFLRWQDPGNWPLLRDALKRMGRADLIGSGKQHLIPAWQPAGTGRSHNHNVQERLPPAPPAPPMSGKGLPGPNRRSPGSREQNRKKGRPG